MRSYSAGGSSIASRHASVAHSQWNGSSCSTPCSLAPSSIRSLIDRKTSSLWAAASAKSTEALFRDLFRMPNGRPRRVRSGRRAQAHLTQTGHTTVGGASYPRTGAASSVTGSHPVSQIRVIGVPRPKCSGERTLAHRRTHSLAACASAEGVWRPTIAGASWTSSSFSRASTMNRAKSTRRVRLLSRIGSPTCRLHTGRP